MWLDFFHSLHETLTVCCREARKLEDFKNQWPYWSSYIDVMATSDQVRIFLAKTDSYEFRSNTWLCRAIYDGFFMVFSYYFKQFIDVMRKPISLHHYTSCYSTSSENETYTLFSCGKLYIIHFGNANFS